MLTWLEIFLWILGIIIACMIIFHQLTAKDTGECVAYHREELHSFQDRIHKLKELAQFPATQVRWKIFFVGALAATLVLLWLYNVVPCPSVLEFVVVVIIIITVAQLLVQNFFSYHGANKLHSRYAEELYQDIIHQDWYKKNKHQFR